MAGSQILTEGPEILFQAFIEHRDRHVIHSGSTFVGGDLRARRKQCAFGVDFVDQAKPLASFDPALSTRILGLFYKAVSREVFVFSVVNRLLVRRLLRPAMIA